MKNESELQSFIADHPWLLNSAFEAVPELPDRGKEFQIGSQKRIDLILLDSSQKRPVVVEFKFTPFYRENIGQILEYKARVALTFSRENNQLFEIFGEQVLTPRLVLVVRECDDFSKVACNLAGIEVYEFQNLSSKFSDPTWVKAIKDFRKSMSQETFPLSWDRPSAIQNRIYFPIRRVLTENNLDWAWQEPRQSNGYYHNQFLHMFVNRWLFQQNVVSIGLIEEILLDVKVTLVFYSTNKGALQKFQELYRKQDPQLPDLEWDDKCSEGTIKMKWTQAAFFNNAESIFSEKLTKYLSVINELQNK